MSRLTGRPIENKNYKVKKSKEDDWKNAIQNSINKLGKLEDIEDELGCPLDVVFRALTDGFEDETRTIYRTDLIKDSKGVYSFSLRDGLNTIYKSYYLKDYQKTWWLKGEKENV